MPQILNLDIVETAGDSVFIQEAGTHTVKVSGGVLVRAIFGSECDPDIEFYDADGLICRIDKENAIGSVNLGIKFKKSLRVVMEENFDVTIVYL